MIHRALLVTCLVWLSGNLLMARVPDGERIRITDPDRLQALGFPRDATNVFVRDKADRVVKAGEGVEASETWGPSDGYTVLMNYQFHAADASLYWLVNGASQGSYCLGNVDAECLGYGQIQVPDGASLDRLDLWANDTSVDSDLHYTLIASCEEAGGQTETVLDSGDMPESDGEYQFTSSLTGITVNNSECGYTLRFKFTDGGEPPRGSAIRLRKARLTWRRQVSPAPAAPTFGDVPTDHPFFQFVEALVQSGITAGCGGGDYCPNLPVTRGQMAVFLAKALGLSWPLPLSE